MSEKLGTNPEPPTQSLDSQLVGTPTDVLPNTEVREMEFEESTPIILGIKKRLHEIRLERATETVEKIDRKDKLYEHLGSTVLGQTTETDNSPKPKTWAERLVDGHMEKVALKKAVKAAERKFTVKAFGGEQSEIISTNTSVSNLYRKHKVNSAYRAGDLTAREKLLAKTEIQATPRGYENPEQRKSRRGVASSTKRLNRAASQPILSRWREVRGNRAADVKNESAERINELSRKIQLRQASKAERRRVKADRKAREYQHLTHEAELFDQD